MKTLKNIIAVLAILSFASYANARDQIKIVGSSTVSVSYTHLRAHET